PIGGSRGSELRTTANLLFLFLLCGLWHGASWAWLAYGLLFGILMVLHRTFDRLARPSPALQTLRASPAWAALSWGVTFYCLLIGLVLVRMPDWNRGGELLSALAGLGTGGLRETPGLVFLLIVLGLSGHLFQLISEKLRQPGWRLQPYADALALVAVVLFRPGVGQTFIYIQF
ncbi:MAG: hypothetical protein ACRCZF_02090, partial [Gemmataceae bacterium]